MDEERLKEVFKIILGDELQETKASIKALEETTKALQEGRERDGEKIKALEEGREKDGEKIKALEEGREKDGEKIKALEEGRERDGEKIKALEEGREKDGEKIKALQEVTKQLDRTVMSLCVDVTNQISQREGKDAKASLEIELDARRTIEASAAKVVKMYEGEKNQNKILQQKLDSFKARCEDLSEANHHMHEILKEMNGVF
ncbi:Spo11/DNA topoisomerase VI subunit A [Nitzschia inconspicua]|uniref:Spo11/DNA topoisomerase VI subunit A n=1 Tax=Nitzschia inconspicua TaxID=303405 RepID=A0A9K3PU65_9STRA|nr:Spo11/DNA topoisomerase VI subunit A [Nitzschia inconspicua]